MTNSNNSDQTVDIAPNQTRAKAPLPPQGPSADAHAALIRLNVLLDGLLDPVLGCPWDRKQTTKTLTEDFLEEVYELRQALLEDDGSEILEEAGDLAFLVVLLGRHTQKTHSFGLKEILDAATDKMLARHPHVFGDAAICGDMESFWKLWHTLKRASKPKSGVLSSVPTDLPALARCHRLSQKAGRAGFDFDSVAQIRKTLDSELKELDDELESYDKSDAKNAERLHQEIGDVLATVVNLSRHLGQSAEKSLDAYNRRFIKRFEYIEQALARKGKKPEDVSRNELEMLWEEAKQALTESPKPLK
jgi:tetrapyrrole methylase family protein/MazG family protein